MKRRHRLFLLIPALLLAVRSWEIAFNTEIESGFYKQPHYLLYLIMLAAVAAGMVLLGRALRGRAPAPSDALEPGKGIFLLCALTGAITAYGCLVKLWEIVRLHPMHHFFMNREQLAFLGFADGWFKLEFVWALFGIAAAAWFILSAVSVFRFGALRGGKYFALVPVLWYCIRAVSRYLAAPINARDSVAVSSVVSLIVLGWTWYAFAHYLNFLEKPRDLSRSVCRAFAALCFTVGLALPNFWLLTLRGSYADAILLVADGLSAICAGLLADHMILTAKENKNVQS